MIRGLDTVVPTHDIGEHGLKQGDIGAVVHRYGDGAAFEVEFVNAEGKTVALLTLTSADVRPMGSREILHIRELRREKNQPMVLVRVKKLAPERKSRLIKPTLFIQKLNADR